MEKQIPSPKTFRTTKYLSSFTILTWRLNLIIALFCFTVIITLIGSCKKTSVTSHPPPIDSPLTITKINPITGHKGDTITIIGTHFNLNSSEDTVLVNGVRADVIKATADTLDVVVPKTGTGVITVNGFSAPGPLFVYVPTIFVTTLAGSGHGNSPNDPFDGPDSLAIFYSPDQLCFDRLGNLYVSDQLTSSIRKISSGYVSTFASLQGANGMSIDSYGNLYVTNSTNIIAQIIPNGSVSDLTGGATNGSVDGPDSLASFNIPGNVAVDPQNNIYIAEPGAIRKITRSGMVTTFAGKGATPDTIAFPWGTQITFKANYGYKDGQDTSARFGALGGLASDLNGNIYAGDIYCQCVRKITPSGLVTTLASTGVIFNYRTTDPGFYGMCVDSIGNVYVSQKSSILKITPAGVITTLVGMDATGYVDGPAAVAQFYYPAGLAFDALGNLFVADQGNLRIRKIIFQ